jgi:uncharacterized membrane protein YfbV (UPF0208 family)
METSTMTIVLIAFLSLWLPCAGLVWLGLRRERRLLQAVARESTATSLSRTPRAVTGDRNYGYDD